MKMTIKAINNNQTYWKSKTPLSQFSQFLSYQIMIFLWENGENKLDFGENERKNR
jgi:hypothetical protein